jgi:uncharacterized protein YbaA (DUF1428 family)
MKYVDGFVLPIPKKNLAAYRRIARLAAKVWKEHGALQYVECLGDDLNVKFGLPFPRMVKPKAGETIWFSWVVYKSKSQRNRICKLVMKDPRLAKMMDPKAMPFDMKRMACGGFKVQVQA